MGSEEVIQADFKHRPSKAIDISLKDFCKNLGVNVIISETADMVSVFEENNFDHILIGGAGILPEKLVTGFKIINSHPAYLPYVRGLDALKWAIYNNQPVGVTSHYIDDKADEGLLIERVEVPLYYEDTFHSYAYRQYEVEIDLLVNAIKKVEEMDTFESLQDDRFLANRRMPHHVEVKMMKRFDALREEAISWTGRG